MSTVRVAQRKEKGSNTNGNVLTVFKMLNSLKCFFIIVASFFSCMLVENNLPNCINYTFKGCFDGFSSPVVQAVHVDLDTFF